MLDHHPQITWLNEFEYAVDLVSDDGGYPDTDVYKEWLAQHRIFQATGFGVDAALEYAAVVDGFFDQRKESTGKPIAGATVHRDFDRLLGLYPDARFIHLVRDPRDVSPSVIRMGWAGNVYTACTPWVQAEGCWDRVASRISKEQWIQIHYEELLEDPERELARACGLIGVVFDAAMLDFHMDTSYSPPDSSAAQRWKTTLSKKQVRLIESRCAKVMADRGYECVTANPRGPTAVGRAYFSLQSRVSRMGARISRFGFGLWAKGIVFKRFSPNKAYPRVKARMDENTKSRLQ
ncbi:MAG: sulfotransferase [Phycisphaerales bacterium]|nr:sulfotransferase [Phycisphaerales bacterium]